MFGLGGNSTDSAKDTFLNVHDHEGSAAAEEHELPRSNEGLKRNPHACTTCRRLKMRCIGRATDEPCQRCDQKQLECVFVASKRGKFKSKKADIVGARLLQMQQTLDNVLLNISSAGGSTGDSKSTNHVPSTSGVTNESPALEECFHVLPGETMNHVQIQGMEAHSPSSNLSRGASRLDVASQAIEPEGDSFGARPLKFPLPFQQEEPPTSPALLQEGIVTAEEAVTLFEIYFNYCQPQAPLLDKELHTPAYTAVHAPLLFSTICTVAARYYSTKPELYPSCRTVVMRTAAETVFSGFTSVSIVQACLILSHWNQPTSAEEGDKTYLFAGVAARMALQLGLNNATQLRAPANADEKTRACVQRETRNRQRTWLFCVLTDRSQSIQMGKPPCLSHEDYLLRNMKSWWADSTAAPTDAAICSVIQLQRLTMTALNLIYSDINTVSGLNAGADYHSIFGTFSAQIEQWRMEYMAGVEAMEHVRPADFQKGVLMLYYHYYRLFVLSFCINNAQDKPELSYDLTHYVGAAYDSAMAILEIANRSLGPTGRLQYSLEKKFVCINYGACFVLKLLGHRYRHIVDSNHALAQVRNVVETLEDAALDATHTPALYASLIKSLIKDKVSNNSTRVGTRRTSRATSAEVQDDNMGGSFGDSAQHEASLMIHNSDFWESMLLPGFGGPISRPSGSGAMLAPPNAGDFWADDGAQEYDVQLAFDNFPPSWMSDMALE